MNISDCIKCDVLVCGGGVGGLAAAISIKELAPETDVLIVEKNFSGWSGKANRGGGVLQYFDYDKIKPEEFAAFHAHEIGAYLGDQELMTTYVAMNHQMMDKLSSWGVNMPRNDDGAYRVMPTGPFTCIICVDLDITLNMRRHAKKLGVRFMDKTVMAELFRDEHGITGAGVYSVLDGTYTTVSAKRVVLATGSQDYRVGPMWSCGRGDGILAAWKAGAEMRNPEFGNFAQLVLVRSHDEIVFGENYMYNAKGEFLTPHFFDHRETDISSKAIREWLIQMEAGDGPVHLDFGGKSRDEMSLERQWYRPYGQRFRELINENAARVDTDLEVAPMFIGEQSCIKVDHDMQTTVPGLFAIGDCSYCGSNLAGAVPAPPGRNRGSGILNAVFAGIMCSRAASQDAAAQTARPISDADVAACQSRLVAPLHRADGATATEVIDLVQHAMAPVELSVVMQADRMDRAMALVDQAAELLPSLIARDWHELMNCHEAEAMVLSAKLHYTASKMRKESRGWFLREDYPKMDNENWLKWIVAKDDDGRIALSTEDVPVEKWPVDPRKAQRQPKETSYE